ncbi:MAG: sulfatase-like hydrolase/transferase [Alphaproteobacteria bacterium]
MSTRVSRAELASAATRPLGVGSRIEALPPWLQKAVKPALLLAAIFWLSMLWNLPVDLKDLNHQAVTTNWPALLLPALAAIVVNASFIDGIAFEILLLTFVIALVPALRRGWGARLLRHLVAAVTLLLVVLCLTDLGVRMVLGRPFAPLLDLGIYANVVDLQKGSFKGLTGWVLTGVQIALASVIYLLSLGAVRLIQRVTSGRRYRPVALTVTAFLLLGYVGGKWLPGGVVATATDRLIHAQASTTIWHQVDRSVHMLTALHGFQKVVAVDQFPELPPDRLLAVLDDVDVLLVFFESYGRSVLDQDRFRRFSQPSLDHFAEALGEAGLVSASAYLTSPTMGGQSWLAHGTLESGLWLQHQSYYNAFIATDRLTLTKAFAKSGHRTVAMKPAIVMPWPEGAHFGFDQIYAAADMGYRGLPYNWVTMPDQYTMEAFEQFERSPGHHDRPVYAEFSLISSHAPWTHIPPVVGDWASIGDGSIFSKWAEIGDPPHVVWADPDRVREQYGKSVRYVLDMLASYAGRYVDDHTLMIIVGDHQPAPLVTGAGASRDVPLHVVTGNPELLQPFLKWGLKPGMHPDERAEVRRMDAFRDWFLEAFSR